MTQRQETATDRLASVIQSIQLGRETGTLRARRGEGITLEDGVIRFVNGQVTEVSVGRRVGTIALNWLMTWGYCRYSFDSPTTEIASPQIPPHSNISGDLKVTDSLHPLNIQSSSTERPSRRIESAPPPTINRDTLLTDPRTVDANASRLPDRAATAPLETKPEENAVARRSDTATHLPSAPYRTREPEAALRVIERVGLSRAHRHLFLLVDGHQTMAEFARLMGKSEQELVDLLDDLQRAGLVRVPDA